MQIMNAALCGRDVFVLMPTGGGKSRCYQLPAVISGGVTVVITPLVSLLEDQLQHTRDAGIEAQALRGGLGQNDVYDDLAAHEPRTRILFLTPEKARLLSLLPIVVPDHIPSETCVATCQPVRRTCIAGRCRLRRVIAYRLRWSH